MKKLYVSKVLKIRAADIQSHCLKAMWETNIGKPGLNKKN